MLGITFGGLSVDSNGEIVENKSFKIFGYIYAFIATILSIIGMFFISRKEDILSIYNTGFPFVYYLITVMAILFFIVSMSNLWFLQHNGLKLLVIIKKYKYNDYCILFNIICFTHNFVVILLFAYETIILEKSAIKIMANFLLKFYFYPIFWAISVFTWLLSILVKDYLVNIINKKCVFRVVMHLILFYCTRDLQILLNVYLRKGDFAKITKSYAKHVLSKLQSF
jgi:hypothetical protein